MRHWGLTLCVVGLVAGCGTSAVEPAASVAPSTVAKAPSAPTTGGQVTPTPGPAGTPEPSVTVTGGNDADLLEEGGAVAAPTWDKASQKAAVDSAVAAMKAFARPGVEQGRWWRDLAPRLSEPARRAYATVDAINVPATAVTGPGELVDTQSPYLAGVDVPTNAGVYRVLLSRSSADDPWLVERLTPSG